MATAAALVLSACGGASGNNNDAAADDADGSQGGEERVYVEALSGDLSGLNPQLTGGPNPVRVGTAIMESLLILNDQYEIHSSLARDWDVSEDGRTITFYLEEDVEWHDGEPFTADDVVFNFEEIVPLHSTGGPMMEFADRVEKVDDFTVTLHMETPYGSLLSTIAQQVLLPKHLYEGTDYVTNPYNMEPVGTGPMMFDSYDTGSQVVLVRNPNWWQGEIEVDKVVYAIMSDANTRGLAMLNGEIDNAVLDPTIQGDVAEHPDLQLLTGGNAPQLMGITFNTRAPNIDDAEVRSLIFSAIDREAITELALQGLGEPAHTFYPEPMSWVLHPDIDFTEDFPRDIDAINARLDELGFDVQDDGYRFTLNARYVATHSEAESTIDVIRSALEDVHIGVNLMGADENVWQDAVWERHDFDINILRNTAGSDPTTLTRWLACNEESVAQRNASGYCDEELQAAADGGAQVFAQDARAEAYHVVQERARDLMYYAPLAWYHGSYNTINTSRWEGLDDVSGRTNQVNWLSMKWLGD
ncbi:MAG TPA: ABC transporter substrate-binding protein [Actinomycetaceae bacterium]|nr:ABC transporter substrate-binding protein [Actinomycetaceae bacterium]